MNKNRPLRWSGSRKAQAEYEMAVRQRVVQYKSRKHRQQKPKQVSYESYIHSKQWKNKRLRCLRAAGFRCSICRSRYELQVHHKTYERLGSERDDDLCVLCSDCHCLEHEELGYVDSLSKEFRQMFYNQKGRHDQQIESVLRNGR